MESLIIVETLGRGSTVLGRTRVAGAVATIGRAYDNDVIVDDPLIDPHALRVTCTPDGGFAVEDLGAVNGVRGPTGPIVGSVLIAAGDEVRVGRSRLRFVTPATPVAPTAATSGDPVLSFVTDTRGIVFGMALVALIWWVYNYATSYAETSTSSMIGQAIGMLMLLAIWSGMWALGSRLVNRRSGFAGHMGVVCWVTGLAVPVTTAVDVFPFLWPGRATGILVMLVSGAFAVWLLHLHLGVTSRLTVQRRALVAVGVVLGFVLVGIAFLEIDEDPAAEVASSMTTLWPIPEGWIPSESIDDFVAGLDGVSDVLDRTTEED